VKKVFFGSELNLKRKNLTTKILFEISLKIFRFIAIFLFFSIFGFNLKNPSALNGEQKEALK
jgi:hypothetical protein